MCCRCCTSLKVAATWGAGIQIAVGIVLLIRYFFEAEKLRDYPMYPFLAYIGLLIFLGVIILLGVQKEIRWLLKVSVVLFLLLQIYGLIIRLFFIPMDEKTVFQRISSLFVGILMTAAYTFILILFSRNSSSSNRDPTTGSTVEV